MAMTLRLPADLDAQLTEVAARLRLSKQQAAIQAVDRFVQWHSHGARVRALATQAAADYPETLRRLGE